MVAKLREAEAALDHSPQAEALSEIAGLVATIAEQYVDGCIGALLPKPLLEGKKPVRDRELLRVAAAVVLISGGVVGLAFLGLPDVAMAALGTAWSVLILMALFGSNWASHVPDFELFKPGPDGPGGMNRVPGVDHLDDADFAMSHRRMCGSRRLRWRVSRRAMSTAKKALVSDQGLRRGAGDENRTRALSLGSSCSTIKLHPRRNTPIAYQMMSVRWWRGVSLGELYRMGAGVG